MRIEYTGMIRAWHDKAEALGCYCFTFTPHGFEASFEDDDSAEAFYTFLKDDWRGVYGRKLDGWCSHGQVHWESVRC